MLEMVFKNITKHKLKSVFAAGISLLIILFLFIYLGQLAANRSELANLSELLPVEGRVSNQEGSWYYGLDISPARVQKLEQTGMIKDVVKTTSSHVSEGLVTYDSEELAKQHFSTMLFSANTMEAFPYIDSIEFTEGYTEAFLKEKEALCILEKSYMDTWGLQAGDIYKATIYRRQYDSYFIYYEMEYVNQAELTIIGSYEIDAIKAQELTTPHVIAAMPHIREVFREAEAPYYLESMRFVLKDALSMNAFKQQVEEIGFKNRNAQADFDIYGNAMTLYDESFIKTAEQLNENIYLMQLFAPLVFLVVAFIGFLASYLLMQSRKNEFAIMRSLGTSKWYTFFVILVESIILALFGGLAGAAVGVVVFAVDIISALLIFLVFLLLYMLGTAVALILLNRFSVLEILTKADE